MALLDNGPATQSGHRVYGEIDGDDISVRFGPMPSDGEPSGNGMVMPNGQQELRLNIQKVRDLINPPKGLGDSG